MIKIITSFIVIITSVYSNYSNAFFGSKSTVTSLEKTYKSLNHKEVKNVVWADSIDFSTATFSKELEEGNIIISAIRGKKTDIQNDPYVEVLLEDTLAAAKKAYQLNGKSKIFKNIDPTDGKYYIVKLSALYDTPLPNFNKELLLNPTTIKNMSGNDDVKKGTDLLLANSEDVSYQKYLIYARKVGILFETDLNLSLLNSSGESLDNFDLFYDQAIIKDKFLVSIATDFAAVLEAVYSVCHFSYYDHSRTLEVCYNVISINDSIFAKLHNIDEDVIAANLTPAYYLKSLFKK